MSLGLYIQVPFCQTKCTYCNFHTGPFSRSLYDPYVAALCREIANYSTLPRAAGLKGCHSEPAPAGEESWRSADTLYIGGGTPSLLDPAALAGILDAVRSSFALSPSAEVTLEADPETITSEKAAAWHAAGINRISLGSQSFHDAELRSAGRLHRRDDIYRADEILRACGFRNISFDLIAGLPHQTASSWRDSLDQLLSLAPEHISIYMLEIDEGSRLGRELLSAGSRYSAPAVPDDDSIASFYETACDLLARSGYDHYEISNWARYTPDGENTRCHPEGIRRGYPKDLSFNHGTRPAQQPPYKATASLEGRGFSPAATEPHKIPPGALAPATSFRSLHNLKYWTRSPYLGFGAGAHSFDGHSRWANAHDPAAYVAAINSGQLPIEPSSCETLTPQMVLDEELFLGLRLLDGIHWRSLEERYNVSLRPRLETLAADGLLLLDGPFARLSPSRLSISNEVFASLLG